MSKNVVAGSYSITAKGTGGSWNSWEPSGADSWYVGVPKVNSSLPAAIMPTLPTASNTRAGWGYDAAGQANPTFADLSNQYYVDAATGNDGTAGNGGRGSVALPRETLPNFTFNGTFSIAAGEQIFVVGDGATYALSDSICELTARGSDSSQSWLIGVGTVNPVFTVDRLQCDISHFTFDHIDFQPAANVVRISFHTVSTQTLSSHHVTFRDCDTQGTGVLEGSNRSVFNIEGLSVGDPAEFYLFLRSDIHDFGEWNHAGVQSIDYHGIQTQPYSRYIWIIDCDIYHMQGDSYQGNTSNQWTYEYASRPHYVYIADCDFYENYENALDNKNVYHTILSSNRIHTFRNAFKPANETALTLSQDSEGYLTGYQWAINNHIYDCGVGIRNSGTSASLVDDPLAVQPVQTAGDMSFIIGNLIEADVGIECDCRSFDRSGTESDRTQAERFDIALNTIVSPEPITNPRGSGATSPGLTTINIDTNIIYEATATDDVSIESFTNQRCNFRSNLVDRVTGSVNIPTTYIQTYTDNIVDQDPLFTNSGTGDYTLQAGSPAVDDSTTITPAALQLFADMYGLSISTDLIGTARPQSTYIDRGAYERV